MATTSSPSAASKENPFITTTTTPPPENIDTPLPFPFLVGISAADYFPYRTSVPTCICLAVSATYTWLLLLHPYLPPAFTRTYSHLLTTCNCLLFSLALTLTLIITIIPTWWAGEEIPARKSGKEEAIRYPMWVFISLDIAAHVGSAGRFYYNRWTKSKEKSDD